MPLRRRREPMRWFHAVEGEDGGKGGAAQEESRQKSRSRRRYKDVLRFGSDRDFKRLSNLLFSHYIGGTESADFYKN